MRCISNLILDHIFDTNPLDNSSDDRHLNELDIKNNFEIFIRNASVLRVFFNKNLRQTCLKKA